MIFVSSFIYIFIYSSEYYCGELLSSLPLKNVYIGKNRESNIEAKGNDVYSLSGVTIQN